MTAIQSVSTTPESLRAASFSDERHGYARSEVHALLTAAADALEVAWRENAALTASGVSSDEGEISSRAVLLLSSAQRIADDAVAEAESYASDLIETARRQYREIVERAQQAAHSIEKRAAAHPGEVPAAQPLTADRSPVLAFATDDLEVAGPASPDDVVRARQFARMATAQVHSLLESIERELGRLGAGTARTTAPEAAVVDPADERRRRSGDIGY